MGIMRRRGFVVMAKRMCSGLVLTAIILSPAAAPAVLTKTCLTGTDPAVAGDRAQILAVRTMIDAACVCASFDGSKGKAHSNYVRCAANIINAQAAVPPGNLRTQCKGTVKKFYTRSTCGTNPALHTVPCIKTVTKSGKIWCTIRSTTRRDGVTPSGQCANGRTFTQAACPAYTTCVDAADTNHDLIIAAPNDTGACVVSPTATPTQTAAGPTDTPTATPTATSTPATCTAVNLTKGPTLIYDGVNTEMGVVWQWSADPTFQLRWGLDTTYSQGSADVTPNDATNHMYGYTIAGLSPGNEYYYQVAVGSQCASGSFHTAPEAGATDVKFFSYGDTRTNGSVHNNLAGQVVSFFQSDPAFQTLNLHVGDWVTGDAEAYWTSEWFSASYGNIRAQDASLSDLGVRGNHEGAATYWKRYFPQPWQPGGLYWSFDYGPMHVTMLDQYTAYNAGSVQYNWLQTDLAASVKPWKFVVLHEPGWSAGGHGNNVTVQNDLQPLFEQYGVKIVFGGHNHYYARAVVNGVTHLTVGGGGAPLYPPQSGYPNVVVAISNYSFGTFSIAGDTLTAQIINNSGAVIDSFSITR
jgi:hypothetical protein